jgi:AGCS family alanine or glycine:cation symporter
MQDVNNFLILIDSYIGSADWFPYVLLGTGLFFTIYLKFPQIRFFRHALKIVSGKFDKKDLPGDTSHFQALATALSGTVGTGNIAGVAFAIHLGGPAALFWMLVTAALGMCTKFVEVALSHKYRIKLDDGSMAGGPMYYMRNANFTLRGKKVNLKWLAAIFAFATVLSSFGTGNMPQINNIAGTMKEAFGFEPIITGAVLAVFLGLVIIGGIKRIASITSKLVPGMAIIYFIGAFAVIFYNAENIIPSLIAIFGDIFTGSAATGGFIGASFAFAFNKGVNRGLFSNEAGQGSAPIAHASAKANEPLSEGMVAILEPFIDTIIICTVTGLVILSSGAWKEKHQNEFEYSGIQILSERLDESLPEDVDRVRKHINDIEEIQPFTDSLIVENGQITNQGITFINARSFADEIQVYINDGILERQLYSGFIAINENGKIADNQSIPNDKSISFVGNSLIHSAPLTAIAFKRGFFGDWGQYIVAIGLLLFAFSTAISWSYYGDRAMTYLFGPKSVVYFRILYVIGFFVASFIDTAIVWNLSYITIALMTIPNLIGIIWLRKDMKNTIREYGDFFEENFPGEKHPKFK